MGDVMSYVKSTLAPSEEILAWGRFHWIFDLEAFAWLVFTFWLLGYGIYKFISMMIRKYSTEIAVTNLRFIYKRGWIRRTTQEFSLQRIESVDFEQSVLGRFLGYGSIRIKGTGTGEVYDLPRLSKPLKFRAAITEARARIELGRGD